ncbi:MAG: argininosuccinate synthase [Patescibacteria group bacterium]
MHEPRQSPDFEENTQHKRTCLLMYSGGVDTSCCVYILQHYYGYRVVTCTVDVGQRVLDLHAMGEKARQLGAIRHLIVDAKEEYAARCVAPVIKANALYDDFYPLGTSVARPLMAEKAVEAAVKEGVDAVAHGCKGRGADAFRLNMTFYFKLPKSIKLVMPINDWWPTRQEEVDFAYAHGIPVPVSQREPFSYDDNLLSNAINYGSIDKIESSVPEHAFRWTAPLERAPHTPALLRVSFERGIPMAVNGAPMELVDIMNHLNELGGNYGIGRVDMIENGLYGNKFRWVYECPGASLLIMAHKDLERVTLPKESLMFKHHLVDPKWAALAYNCSFHSPLARALERFIEEMNNYVTGSITLRLVPGSASVVTRESPYSLVGYDPKDIVPREKMDSLPYGFEEYAFAGLHSYKE